jgi:hypothetical protein
VVDPLGNRDQHVRGIEAILAVRAERRKAVRDGVADPEAADAGAEGIHHADALESDDHGRVRHRPGVRHAAAVIGVRVVHADRGVADAHLPVPGRSHLHGFPAKVLRRTFLVDDRGHAHARTPRRHSPRVRVPVESGARARSLSCIDDLQQQPSRWRPDFLMCRAGSPAW